MTSRRRVGRVWPVIALAVALLLASGVLLDGYRHTVPRDAPLPDQPFSLEPGRVPDPPPAPSDVARQPDRLVIPSLGVTAPLGEAGVEDNQLVLPDDVDATVLWDGSAPIGAQRGSVLVAGHLDNAAQEHGALYGLSHIVPGAAIYVVAHHQVTSWKVTGLAAALKTNLPAHLWNGATGPRRLYVVTCGGPIVDGHYADNVVVTAVPISR